MINKILLVNIITMLLFCILLAYMNFKFAERHQDDYSYIFEDSESAKVQALKSFGSFFLLNNSFIPLDLAVGLEMGKFLYIHFLERDLQMMTVDEDKRELVKCSVKNFNLHEDLAQLDYIFCDKTGTLTQNELIFKAFKVCGEQHEAQVRPTQVVDENEPVDAGEKNDETVLLESQIYTPVKGSK